ncbi:MAG: ABC transporter substrate binding protein [Bradyrhizobium sp.]
MRRAAAALGVELHSGPMRGPADLDAPLPPLPGGRTRRQNVLRCSKGRRRAVIAVLGDANQPEIDVELRELEVASDAIERQILIAKAAGERDFNAAFARIVKAGAGALVVRGGPVFLNQRRQLVALAARHALPAAYVSREYPEAGGLMSYGPSLTHAYRQAGTYVGRILKGEKPGDLPVELASKFEFVINLATAKGMGLDIRRCCSHAPTR